MLSQKELIVLSCLSGGELYGLGIVHAVEQSTNGEVKLSIGNLYPLLRQMEESGLVSSRWGEDRPKERSGARRRYYSLTQAGRDTIDEFKSMLDRLESYAVRIDKPLE